jgi:hypothetical protein
MVEAQFSAYFPQSAVPTLIDEDCKKTIANVFCFGDYADQYSGVVYNYLMGNFPFMSFDDSVCFLILYHYKADAIGTTPIARLDEVCIFNAYKLNFDDLKRKGFKPTLNIMDNLAMKYI